MSLIVYISFPFSVLPGFFALRVRSAGHALTSNKGCTKRQSLPNCQQNGRPDPEYCTGECGQRCYFVRNGTDAKVQRSKTFFRKSRPTGRQPNSAAYTFRLQESRHPDRTAEGSRPGKSSKKKARQKTAGGRREPEKRETTGGTKASVTKTDETRAAGIKTARREKTGRKQEEPA